MKFTEIATDLQDFVAMRTLLKKNRVQLQSGTGIQWDVMVNHSDAAANVGLYATDNVNVVDGMVQASSVWRNTTTNYAIDRRELAMNRTPAPDRGPAPGPPHHGDDRPGREDGSQLLG